MTPRNPVMARYLVLRYLAACTESGVTATEAYACRLCEVDDRAFGSACASLVSDGLVSGIEVTAYLDGSRGVCFEDAAPSAEGWRALSGDGGMAAAREACDVSYEVAVDLAVQNTRRIERIIRG